MDKIVPKFTSAGNSMLISALAGSTLMFTKMKIGNGAEPSDYTALTELVNPLLEAAIIGYEKNSDNVVLTFAFDTTSVEESFHWTETGVFASVDGGAEQLYAYVNTGEDYDTIPSAAEGATYSWTVTLPIYVSDANDIVIDVGDSIYASKADLLTHINDTDNPHSVTASQVGLGNVDNTSDVNKPVSTKQAAADATVLSKAEMRDMAFAARLLGWDIYDGNINTVNGTYPFNSFGEKTAILYSDYNTSDDLLDTWNLGYDVSGTFYVANLTLNTIIVALPKISTGDTGVAVVDYENVLLPSGSMATIDIAWSSSVNMPYGSCTYEDFDPIGDLASKLSEGGVV